MKLLDISIVEGRPPSMCRRQQKKVATESRVGGTYHTAVTYERRGLLTNLSAYTNTSFIVYTELSPPAFGPVLSASSLSELLHFCFFGIFLIQFY